MISINKTIRFLLIFTVMFTQFPSAMSAQESDSPEPPPLIESLDGELPENLLPFDPTKKRSPEAQKKIDAGAYYMHGVLLEKRGEFQDAMREYAKAIEIDPQAIEAYRSLIMLNIRFNRPESAQGLLLQALKHAPDDGQLLQLLGTLRRRVGQVVQAIDAFENALKSPDLKKGSQKHTLLLMELGPLYRNAGMLEKAAETYEVIMKAFAEPTRYGLNQQAVRVLMADENFAYDTAGQIFLEAGKYQLALEAFNKAADNPRLKSEEIGYFKSKIFLAQKKPKRALEELEPYLSKKLQSQGLGPYQLLTDIYTALDRQDDIETKLEELQQNDDNNNFIIYALANIYRQRDENAKAIELFQKAIGRGADPEGYQGLMDVYFSEGRAEEWLGALSGLLGLGRNVDGIEEQFKQVSDNDEFMKKLVVAARAQKEAGSRKFNFPEAYIIGRLAAASKRNEYVVEFYNMAMSFRPNQRNQLTAQLIQYLREQEDNLLLAETLEKAMKSPGNPQLKAAYTQLLAQALMSLTYDQEEAGDRKEALKTITRAQETVPGNPLLTYRRGWLEWRNGHPDAAVTIFQSLIAEQDFRKLEKDSQLHNLLKQCHFLLSAILVEQGDAAAGQKILESVYEYDPTDPSVNNDLGYLYADQNIKLEQAEKMIRLALKAEPENHAYLDSLGWVLFRRDKLDEALDYLLKAVEGSEDGDSTLWDHLGDVYQKMGNAEKAKESWETALKQAKADDNPDLELMNKIRKKLGLPEEEAPMVKEDSEADSKDKPVESTE